MVREMTTRKHHKKIPVKFIVLLEKEIPAKTVFTIHLAQSSKSTSLLLQWNFLFLHFCFVSERVASELWDEATFKLG